MKQKTKILNVLTVIEDGGMETLVSNIYEGLSAGDEFEFYICCLVGSEKTFVYRKLEKYCKEIFVLSIKNKNLFFTDYFVLFKKLFVLAHYISANKFDVVNSHDFFSGTYARLAVLISKYLFFFSPKKNYLTLHNLFFWLSSKHHFINKLLSWNTDNIICVSRSVFEYSLKNDKAKLQKYKVILNGIDEKLFKPDSEQKDYYLKEFNLAKDNFIIGNIGTLSVRKGHIYLVKAFKELVGKLPHVRLLIIGSSRGHEADVKNEVFDFVKKNDLSDKVIFADSRNDIRKVYNLFDMYVMSSVSEGLSLAAIEAMLMERICVFSDIGPFKELVTENVNGFLFKSQDHISLYKKLEEVIIRFSEHGKIGRNARESVIEKFNYQRMIDEYYNMYNCYKLS